MARVQRAVQMDEVGAGPEIRDGVPALGVGLRALLVPPGCAEAGNRLLEPVVQNAAS